MSTNDYDIPQLRFWDEPEIEHRERAQEATVSTVRRSLLQTNPAWSFRRLEAPQLIPRDLLSTEYSDDDLWVTPVSNAERQIVLRPETTPATYAFIRARSLEKKIRWPACFWQSARSFRREKTARASRLRFFEFWQLELQCLYSADSKADYRARLRADTISWLTRAEARVVESDRLPAYSLSTMDIEVRYRDEWREMASVSIRNDFAPDVLNLEVAVGLDRIVEVWNAA